MARISARWRPNTFSMASEISPTLALARAALTARSKRLALPRAPSVSALSAACAAFSSRSPRSRCSLAICCSRTDLLSTFRMSICASSLTRYLFTPTMGCLLDAHFRNAGGDRLGHAAQPLDLLDMGERFAGELVRQPLDVVAAAPRI